MHGWLDTLLIVQMLTNVYLLGSSRLMMCVRVVALQGVILGALTLLSQSHALTIHTGLLALASVTLKGVVFPWLLMRALREADVLREIEPLIGYVPSLLMGAAAFGMAVWIGSRLPMPGAVLSPLVVPVAFFAMFTGLILIVGRRKALTQALGYLVLENGIFLFGASMVLKQPVLVETGVLLDVFFAVFVFGIAIFHINREFNHIDTDQLATLKD